MSSLKRSGNTPKPPRTAVLPSPVTSHENPMRGATWMGGVSSTPFVEHLDAVGRIAGVRHERADLHRRQDLAGDRIDAAPAARAC